MTRSPAPLFLAILLAVAALQGQAKSGPTQTAFKTNKAEGYRPVTPALRAYLQAQPQLAKGQQHFCVIGYELLQQGEAQGARTAWVHWVEGKRLVQWSPAAEGFTSADTLLHATREIDLDKDVEPVAKAVNSSTYTVDRQWVKNLQADCRLRGERFQLRPR